MDDLGAGLTEGWTERKGIIRGNVFQNDYRTLTPSWTTTTLNPWCHTENLYVIPSRPWGFPMELAT